MIGESEGRLDEGLILPSELKKRLRERKRLRIQTDGIGKISKGVTDSKLIRVNDCDSTKKDTTITSKKDVPLPDQTLCLINQLHISVTEVAARIIEEKFTTDSSSLIYYQYPFPSLPHDAGVKIKRLLSNSDANWERQYFSTLVGDWKRSFSSLFDSFMAGKVTSFYYIHSDLVAVFVRGKNGSEDNSLKSYITKASPSFLDLLTRSGVEFTKISPIEAEGDEPNSHPQSDNEKENNDFLFQAGGPDEETFDTKKINDSIKNRINKMRQIKATVRSTAPTLISITRQECLSELKDIIYSQKDSRSSVIIPELYADGPFLGGTECALDLKVVGPLINGNYQIDVSGHILPSFADEIFKSCHLFCNGKEPFNVKDKHDTRTEPFALLKYS